MKRMIFHFLASQEFLPKILHWKFTLRPSQVKTRILYFLEKFEFNKYHFLVILQKVFPIGDLFETFDCL